MNLAINKNVLKGAKAALPGEPLAGPQPAEVQPAMGVEELLKSASSLCWALAHTLLPAVELPFSLGDSNRKVESGNRALDQLQLLLTTFSRAILAPEGPVPRQLMKTFVELMLESSGFLQLITTSQENRSIWQEFHNKLRAYYLFEHADSILGIAPDARHSLPDLVQKASTGSPYLSVWVTEGVGHHYTDCCLQQQIAPEGLLRNNRGLPPASMVPLHSGMGLSLAESLLKKADCCENAVKSFIVACRRNAEPAYLEVAYEALGLVTRNLYPHLLGPISLYLSRSQRELYPYFWHGVGRAIYFSPLNFLPYRSAPWAGIEVCVSDPPNIPAKRNALAGFAWAMTLVNLRHPEILALLLRHHGRNLPDSDAFINGVYSSVIVWRDSAPLDPSLDLLCRVRSEMSGICHPELWDRFFRQPCEQALRDYSTVSAEKQIGTLFHF